MFTQIDLPLIEFDEANCMGARNILAGRTKADERQTFSSLNFQREIIKFEVNTENNINET